MEGVVVEVPPRAPRKRFAIKDNGIRECSPRGFDGDSAKPHSFFSLRTMRVVTRTSANLSMSSFWIGDQREAGRHQRL
jgi:hypothetical protein